MERDIEILMTSINACIAILPATGSNPSRFHE